GRLPHPAHWQAVRDRCQARERVRRAPLRHGRLRAAVRLPPPKLPAPATGAAPRLRSDRCRSSRSAPARPAHDLGKASDRNYLLREAYVLSLENVNAAPFALCMTALAKRRGIDLHVSHVISPPPVPSYFLSKAARRIAPRLQVPIAGAIPGPIAGVMT